MPGRFTRALGYGRVTTIRCCLLRFADAMGIAGVFFLYGAIGIAGAWFITKYVRLDGYWATLWGCCLSVRRGGAGRLLMCSAHVCVRHTRSFV